VTEQAIKQLFAGRFPWHQASGGAERLPVLLVERFRDACAEDVRTLEELALQPIEQQRTVRYLKYLSNRASATAADLQAQHIGMYDAVMQQVAAAADKAAAAGSLKGELQQVSQLCAQQLLHEEWAQRFTACAQQAEAAFGA